MLFLNEFVAKQHLNTSTCDSPALHFNTNTHTQPKSVLDPLDSLVFFGYSFLNVVICDISEINKALTLFFPYCVVFPHLLHITQCTCSNVSVADLHLLLLRLQKNVQMKKMHLDTLGK